MAKHSTNMSFPHKEISNRLHDELSQYHRMLDLHHDIRAALSLHQESDVESLLGEEFLWSRRYETSFNNNWILSVHLSKKISLESDSGFTIPIPLTTVAEIISADVDLSGMPSEIDVQGFKRSYLELIMANFHSTESLTLYGRSIFSLVIETDYGNDEAMFKALRVDPTAITCPTFARRLQRAFIEDDKDFFRGLRKSLNNKPVQLENVYRDLRLALYLLERHGFIDKLTEESAYQILCENLELYPIDGDAARSLWKLVSRWKKERRHENEFSCRGPDY